MPDLNKGSGITFGFLSCHMYVDLRIRNFDFKLIECKLNLLDNSEVNSPVISGVYPNAELEINTVITVTCNVYNR